jgi:hypothetical protein
MEWRARLVYDRGPMGSTHLDRLLRIFSALMLPLVAGPGCAIDTEQFTEDMCEDSDLTILQAVLPAMGVDSLELREGFLDLDTVTNITVLDATGTPCASASDPQACADADAALTVSSGFSAPGYESYGTRFLAFTRGDEVGTISTPAQLAAFLGPIDATGDAALQVLLLGGEYRINCNSGNEVGPHGDNFVVFTASGTGCGRGDNLDHQALLVRSDGSFEELDHQRIERGDPGCAIGRLPPGLSRRRCATAADPVGAYFAEVAQLEAAAVPAFGQFARELALHGAPPSQVRAALRARADEVRHARVTASLARRHGGRPTLPRVHPSAPRSLVDVARDNATEGCIRETYGALIAHLQARRARDPQVRRALARIARDETRHAALSWEFAAWANARMSPTERRQVAQTTLHNAEQLEAELTRPQHPRVHDVAGLPSPAESLDLYRRLRQSLGAELHA